MHGNTKIKFPCHVQNNPPIFPIISQLSPVHAFPPYSRKVSFNNFLPTPRPYKQSPSFAIFHKMPICLINIWGEIQIVKL